MKKYLFFTLFITGLWFTPESYAQNTFAPVGAEWWYYSEDEVAEQGIYMLLHAEVKQDTLFEGRICQVIEQEGIKKTGFSFSPGTPFLFSEADTLPFRSLYVYDNADTVFIYNDLFGKFTPLYVYNVTEGQTLCLPMIRDAFDRTSAYNPANLGDSTFCIYIDSVRTLTYDNTDLKTIFTHALYDPSALPADRRTFNWSFADYDAKGMYAERIGGVHGGILPKILYDRGLFDDVEPTARIQLNCYTNTVTDIKVTDSACNYLPASSLSVAPRTAKEKGILIYPNPSRGKFVLKTTRAMPQAMDIQVADLSGRMMVSSLLPAGKTSLDLDLEHLNTGIYLLSLQVEGQRYYQKLVISR